MSVNQARHAAHRAATAAAATTLRSPKESSPPSPLAAWAATSNLPRSCSKSEWTVVAVSAVGYIRTSEASPFMPGFHGPRPSCSRLSLGSTNWLYDRSRLRSPLMKLHHTHAHQAAPAQSAHANAVATHSVTYIHALYVDASPSATGCERAASYFVLRMPEASSETTPPPCLAASREAVVLENTNAMCTHSRTGRGLGVVMPTPASAVVSVVTRSVTTGSPDIIQALGVRGWEPFPL